MAVHISLGEAHATVYVKSHKEREVVWFLNIDLTAL